MTEVDPRNGAVDVHVIDLGVNGGIRAAGRDVPTNQVADYLGGILEIPSEVTDIFVFAHGWRNSRMRALSSATRLYNLIGREYRLGSERYSMLHPFRPFYVAVRWPSMSLPFPIGYRRIRDRAHAMTLKGHASHVLAQLLGYLHEQRTPPLPGPGTLGTKYGQFLHCLGHSFGARFMGEAITAAADPPTPPSLGWLRRTFHPFAVDTFIAIQMAAPADILAGRLMGLTEHAPLHGPVVATFSRHDRANRLWHRLPEGVPGVGAIGIEAVGNTTIRLKQTSEAYVMADFSSRVVNVDATARFRGGRWLRPEGAHSDYLHAETAHLVLSLSALAR